MADTRKRDYLARVRRKHQNRNDPRWDWVKTFDADIFRSFAVMDRFDPDSLLIIETGI